MINHIMKNSALCAKVQAMAGGALTDGDYRLLMNMSSVSEVTSYLIEKTSYKEAFSGISSPLRLHRGEIERRLRENLRYDVKRLMPFMDMGSRKFMELFYIEEGISKIKVCLRLIHINHPDQIQRYMSRIIIGKKQLSAETISGAKTIDEFIEQFRDTPYYTPLSVFCGKGEQINLFRIEMALDGFYADMVYKYAKKYLSSRERDAVLRVYGTEFDLENISFLLRCKRTFEMTDEEIYAGVIHQYHRIREETISKIVKCGSYEDAISIIKRETPYGNAFELSDRFIEKRKSEYIMDIKTHMYNKNRYSMQSPICYIHRRRTERDNIISILEGIRYGLDPEKIQGHLVGYGRKEAKK